MVAGAGVAFGRLPSAISPREVRMAPQDFATWLANVEKKIDKVIENHGQRIAKLEVRSGVVYAIGGTAIVLVAGVAIKLLIG